MASVRGPISSTAAAFLLTVACGPTSPDADAGIRDAVVDAPAIPLCERAADCEAPGAECVDVRCAPSDPAADGRGCVVTPRCVAGEICEAGRCVPECGSPDRDRDGDPSIACGGADCDDDDSGRSSLRVEVCDEAGIDEDCDPTTIAGESDGDADGDDLIDHRCFNVRDDGSENRGPDCDQTVAGTGLGSVDHCGACGDACQFACEAGSCDDPIELATGLQTTCAVTVAGRVWCWGDGSSGQLGSGDTRSSSLPQLAALPAPVASVDGAGNCFAAVTSDGRIFRWGDCGGGPSPRPGNLDIWFPDPARSVAVGGRYLCAVLTDDQVRCFGDNTSGQLGLGYVSESGVGTISDLNARSLDAAADYACATTVSGEVRCWGQELYGSLGDGGDGTDRRTEPTVVPGVGAAVRVEALWQHTCAANGSGVSCWGWNQYGELGIAASPDICTAPGLPRDCANSPQRVPGPAEVSAVSVGFHHSCAIAGGGVVWCWGANSQGQVGVGTVGPSAPPGPVPGLAPALDLALGNGHSCAISDNLVHCWGDNRHGQLGDGTVMTRTLPVRVAHP